MKRKVIILLLGAVLAVAPVTPARAATEDFWLSLIADFQQFFGWQEDAKWTENLYNAAERLLTADAQLEQMLEQTQYLRAAYDATSIFVKDPIVTEIYEELEDYYNTAQNVRQSIQANLLSGNITPHKAANVMRSLVYPEALITEDVAFLSVIMMRRGEKWPEKIEAMRKLLEKIKRHRVLLDMIYGKEIDDHLDYMRKLRAANEVHAAMGTIPIPDPEINNDFEKNATDVVAKDRAKLDRIVERAKEIGEVRRKITLKETKNALGQARQPALDISSVIIGIMASIAIAFAYSKRHRGEHQSADALYKVFAGLVFAIIFLQIVQTVIMNLVK